jgi:hypothetical protein
LPSERPRIGWGLLISFLAAVSAAYAKTYVTVPAVEWEALVPYVRANIVAELQGDEFAVYVCPAHTDRSAVTPFDEALSDFTRVLITQSMRHDPGLEDAIAAATEGFRTRVPGLTQAERAQYRSLFWQSLSSSSEVLPRLEAQFRAAKAKGRLRCWLCEKEPSYAPAAPRLGTR